MGSSNYPPKHQGPSLQTIIGEMKSSRWGSLGILGGLDHLRSVAKVPVVNPVIERSTLTDKLSTCSRGTRTIQNASPYVEP